jgi:hypothetical protein
MIIFAAGFVIGMAFVVAMYIRNEGSLQSGFKGKVSRDLAIQTQEATLQRRTAEILAHRLVEYPQYDYRYGTNYLSAYESAMQQASKELKQENAQ